jgi:hypothetical protein
MKKNMFDLHYLTFWGIVIIGIGTLVGTILIQRGNVLKSKEGSLATQDKLDSQKEEIAKMQVQLEIQTQKAESLRQLSQQQNVTLENQSQIIAQQLKVSQAGLDILDETKKKDFLINLKPYKEAIQEFRDKSYFLFQKSFPKEKFLSLDIKTKIEIFKTTNTAIDKILNCKIVISDYEYYSSWIKVKYFALISFQVGMLNPNSWTTTQINGKLLNSQEEYLNKFYEGFQNETSNLFEKIIAFQTKNFTPKN